MSDFKVVEGAYIKTETRFSLARFLLQELIVEYNVESTKLKNKEITKAEFVAYLKGAYKNQLNAIRSLDAKAQVEENKSTYHKDNGASLSDIREVNGN